MRVSLRQMAPDLRLPGLVYRQLTRLMPEGMPEISTRKRSVELARKDGTSFGVLVHRPETEGLCPMVLWMHGGGFSLGMPEMIYMSAGSVFLKDCIVVCPDYSLGPFPGGLEDGYETLLWMRDHASELGGNLHQIFVGGESAGGNLAAALCLLARDRQEVSVACQFLVYPMLDARMKTASMKDNDAPVWNERLDRRAWDRYLNGCPAGPLASPSLEENLRGLPPVISFVGSIDPFRDETKEYIGRLKEAGTFGSCRVFEGCYHAFDMLVPWSKEARAARRYFRKMAEFAILNFRT